MFVRFVGDRMCPHARVPVGLFEIVIDLRDNLAVSRVDRFLLWEILYWFGDHLRYPDRFHEYCRGQHPDTAICWFRDGARRHIAKMWEMAYLVERNGHRVHFIKTRRPGIVVYEDRYQVAAVPFREHTKMPLP